MRLLNAEWPTLKSTSLCLFRRNSPNGSGGSVTSDSAAEWRTCKSLMVPQAPQSQSWLCKLAINVECPTSIWVTLRQGHQDHISSAIHHDHLFIPPPLQSGNLSLQAVAHNSPPYWWIQKVLEWLLESPGGALQALWEDEIPNQEHAGQFYKKKVSLLLTAWVNFKPAEYPRKAGVGMVGTA